MKILITGAAGFIGFHLSKKLLKEGEKVFGIDNLNSYYDQNLKKNRLKELEIISENNGDIFKFFFGDISDKEFIFKVFEEIKPDFVINLAAQAGVRYSLENPSAYIDSNIVGFANILEACRNNKITKLIYASSSSVYGGNKKMPFSETDSVDHPVSLYAASKKANELMAHTYSHLYGLSAIGLRFFTVYGPWGRPDMALYLFTKSILEEKPIEIFNYGKMMRDFTFIDDIVESIFRLIKKPVLPNKNFDYQNPDPSSSWTTHRIFNIGNSNPVELMDYIKELETALGKNAIKKFLPIQKGDVEATFADTSLLTEWIGFSPKTSIKSGIYKFIEWYKSYHQIE